jgi:hypothetical protein
MGESGKEGKTMAELDMDVVDALDDLGLLSHCKEFLATLSLTKYTGRCWSRGLQCLLSK